MSYAEDDWDEDWGRDDPPGLIAASGLDQTRDDTDYGWGERTWSDSPRDAQEADLERFRRERPPHHGD